MQSRLSSIRPVLAQLTWLAAIAVLVRPAVAQEKTRPSTVRVVEQDGAREEWQLMYMEDAKIGFVHVLLEPIEQDGKRVWRSLNDSSITINRLGTSISVLQKVITFEDDAGQMLSMESESNTSVAKSRTLVTVAGDRAEVVKQIAGPPQITTIDWSRDWLGTRGSEIDSRNHLQAGDTHYVSSGWTPDTGPMVTTTDVLGEERVTVPGSGPGTGEQTLLKTRSTIDVQPGVIAEAFLDPATFEVVMTSTKMMGMHMITVASTKTACLAAFANPDTPEIFERLSPRTNVRLPNPYHSDEIVLRMAATDPDSPLPPLVDERQTLVEQRGKDELVLRVRKVVPVQPFTLPLSGFTAEELECLEPNLQIESGHPGIIALAKQAVGAETDAWKAACALERFASTYISNKGMSSLFETAAMVMESKAGDCTEHGVFLAALCRAAGIPARVAVGFLYFKGIWGGHMWSEVSLGGKWYALDAVLGYGGVDAGHIRLGADSLKSTEIARLFANINLGMTMKIDLLSYRHGDKEVTVGETPIVFVLDGARYRHLLFGLSLTVPEGFTATPNQQIKLGDDEIVELTRVGGGKVEVRVVDVTYDSTLDDAKGLLESNGVSRLKPKDAEIDGRKARLFRGKHEKVEALAAAVLRDQTLVLITGPASEEAAFNAIVASLDLDG